MSDPNEQEKLTPDSFNGYDRSSTPMPEENKSDQPEKSEYEDNEKKDYENVPKKNAKKNGEEELDEVESGKKKSAWAEIFSALVASVASKNNPSEEKIFDGAIKSYTRAVAQDIDNPDKEDPNKNVAKFLKIFLNPKETTPHTTDKEREQTKETREIFYAILESVRDLEETEETGLEEEKVLKELAKMTKEENKQLPETHEDRFKELEKNVKETLDDASEVTLETLLKEWEALRKTAADKTQLDEAVYEKVLEADTLLAELTRVETKEHKGYAEMDEAVRREYDRVYAQFAYGVAAYLLKEPPFVPEVEVAEGESIDPRQHASWINSIIFMPGESPKSKEEKVAALLKTYPVEGTVKEKLTTAAIREQIVNEAKSSNLNLERIFDIASQPAVEPESERVNELKEIPALNEFEQLIEQDILNAKPEKIEDIQNEWKKLLATPDLDAELKEQAEEAVKVLQNIYNLKKMVEEKENGEHVINRHLEPPKNFGEVQEENNDEVSYKANEEQFVKALMEMLKNVSPDDHLTSAEVKAISVLLGLVVTPNRRTKADIASFLAEKKIAQMLFALPVDHENADIAKIAKKIRKQSFNYAYDEKLKEDEITKELKRLEGDQAEEESTIFNLQDPFVKLKDIVVENVGKVNAGEARELQESVDELLAKIDPDIPLFTQSLAIKDSLGKVIEAKEKTGKEFNTSKDLDSEKEIDKDQQKELKKLKGRVSSIDNQPMQDHVRELVKHLQEGMTPGQMEKALKALNKRAQSVTSEMKSDITDEYTTTQLKQKIFQLFALEANINDYRKFLIGEIHRDRLEAFEKNIPEVQKLLAETERVNSLETFKSLSVEKLEQYIDDLTKVLKAPGSLTANQLNAISLALQTQEVIARENLLEVKDNEVVNRFVKAADLFEAVQKVQADLYGHEVSLLGNEKRKDESDDRHRENETIIRHKEKEHARASGYIFHGQVTALGTTYAESQQAGRHAITGDPIVGIENAPSQPAAAPTQKNADYQADYIELVRQSKEQRNYSDTQTLDQLVTQLNGLVSAGREKGLQFSEMKEAHDLARIVNKQRGEVLAMEQLYKGRHDERDYDVEDAALYEGYVHTALGERIKRIQIELGIRNGTHSATYQDAQGKTKYYDRRSNEDLQAYYTELRKWTKILLKNDGRNGGGLDLSNDRFRRYSEIASDARKNLDLTTANGRQTMFDDVEWMFKRNQNDGDFLRHFMRNTRDPKGIDPEKHDTKEFNPDKLLGVDYRHAEGMSSFGLPKSLEDSMAILARQYTKQEGTNYKTGGDRELIDGEGNFKYNNLYYLIREQINADIDYNKDGQINPFQKINLKGDASQVTLQELLLLVPEYLSQRNFEIKMHDGEVVAGWGIPTEHPDFSWAQANQLGAEIEFRVLIHEVRIAYITASRSGDKGKFLELMGSLHNSNHWSRGGKDGPNVLWLLGLPSSVVDDVHEIDKVYGKEEMQGSVGKAICDILMGYYYLSDMTDYYKKENGTEKTFNENMFYKLWEPNGSMTFLTSMAEESLGRNTEARNHYADFIKSRIADAATTYSRNLSTEERTKLMQIKDQFDKGIDVLKRKEKMNISFTESNELTQFYKRLQKELPLNIFRDDEELRKKVRDDIVDNLKRGYFASLYNMQVPEIDTDFEGKDRKDASGLYYRTKGQIRFGSIALKKDKQGNTTYSMEDFLNDFDPDQIKVFDYTNKNTDPDNPFAGITDPQVLRQRIDAFMDHRSRNHDLFKQNEKMMLAFTKHINRIPREWINHMRDIPENEDSRELIRVAFRKCVEKAHGIDPMESEYAWYQGRDYTYIWGDAEMNDVKGIGFRMYGKLLKFGEWRAHRGGKDGYGNEETVEEFHALSLPFLHALRILDLDGGYDLGHQSVWSVIQGGHGDTITPRALRQFKARSRYRTPHDAEELYVANNLTNASNLVDLIATTEVDFTKIVQFDKLGNIVFDYGEAYKLFKSWRKAIRYALQKNNLDYREVIHANGKETSLYRHFFGKKTRALNELKKREIDWITDDAIYKEPADAMMLSLLAAEVHEHRKMHLSGHHWTIENVLELEQVFRKFMQELDREEKDGEIEVHQTKNTFTHGLFNSALKAYHTAYYRMYSTELNSTFWAGLFNGLWAGVKAYFGKGKWIW